MSIIRRIQTEPVAVQAIIVAAIAVGTSFGLSWTAEQVGAVTSLSSLILAFIARRAVTPTVKLPPPQS